MGSSGAHPCVSDGVAGGCYPEVVDVWVVYDSLFVNEEVDVLEECKDPTCTEKQA